MILPSYKKVLKKSQFYEREEHINIFKKELLESKENDLNLLMFYGIGGIGKTTLINHLYKENTENNLKIFINLEEYNTPITFYSKLITELFHQNVKLLNLKIAYSIYWNKINPNLPMKENEAFKGEWEALLPIIDGVGFGVGSIFKVLYSKQDEFKNKVLNNYKKELEELETMSAKEIELLLPKFLNYDLINNMKDRTETIIFFFDTHEYLFETNKKENNKLKCDAFLRDMIVSTYEIKNLFVITGREKLVWNKDDEDWDKMIKHIEVNSISQKTAKLYLQDNGIDDENIIENIIKYTECVPFYLNLELNTYLKLENPTIEDFSGSKTKKDIFNRFMIYADNNELQLLKVLSYTKKFNIDLFEKIIKEFNIPVSILMFEDFVSNSYIKMIDNDNYSLHNLMKNSIQNSVENKMLKEKINKFLFNYYVDNVEEQLHYAFEIFDMNGVYDYLQTVIEEKNLHINYYLLISLYEKYLEKYDNDFKELNKIEIKNKIEETKAKNYMLIYVNFGLLCLKIKDINSFNDLNTSLDITTLNKECSSLKNYMFLKYILSTSSKDYIKTNSFFEKINLKLLPYNFSIDLKIEMANFYRQKKEIEKSKKLFSKIEQEIKTLNLINNHNLINYNLKFGYLYKDLEDYENALLYMNKAVSYVETEEDTANIKRGLSIVYGELKETELLEKNIVESIEIYNKIYGLLNHKSLTCYKILKENNIDLDDVFYKIYILLDDENLKSKYNKILHIFNSMSDSISISNILNYVLKKLIINNININIDDIINIVLQKVSKEDYIDVRYKSYLYYKNYDLEKSKQIIEEIYNLEKDYSDFKILASLYNNLNLVNEFKIKYEKEIKKLNEKKLLEIYKILSLENEILKIISLTPKSKISLDCLFDLSSKFLFENINEIEQIFNVKELDIVYSYVLKYCEKNNDKELIEKYLKKQIEIREKYNLENLSKGYGFLSKFYLDNNRKLERIEYTKKELEILIKENKTHKIGKVKTILSRLERQFKQ